MTEPMEKRACELAVYIIETGATVRAAARHFGISKSTVHKDITCRLSRNHPQLYPDALQFPCHHRRSTERQGAIPP